MRINRRRFCGLSVGLAAACGTPGAPQSQARPAIGPSRWPAALSEGDFLGIGADFAEVRTIEELQIPPGDLDAYLKAWMDLAQRVERKADDLAEAGRRVSAHEAYLRAANYYQRAYMGLLRAGDARRIVGRYRQVRGAWTKAWNLVSRRFEEVDIPYRGTTLPGLFVHADPCARSRLPVVLFAGGSDHLNERSYIRFEPLKVTSRGISYLTLDSPGQGEPLNLRKIGLVPDYEVVAAAALDYLATRDDIDMSRVGAFGQAFGGFFAARAALDPRIRAVACRSASLDLLSECYDYSPDYRAQLEYMLGLRGEAAARRALKAFTLAPVVERIRVPIAIYHGGRDESQEPEGARRLYEAIPHSNKILKIIPEGGRNAGGREPETELLDWLAARLV